MKGSDEEIVVIPPANERKRSRAQPVEFPTDCILTITVHIITVNPTLQYIKSQRNTSYTVEYASSILNNIDNDDPSNNAFHPTVIASELQKIIVNFFASRATQTVDYIAKSRGIETSLIGDSRADFNYSTSGPLFYCQKKRVTLITNPNEELSVTATSYGYKGSSQSYYSPWTIEAGLLKVSGTPALLPSICLGMQIKLAILLADCDDVTVTSTSLLDIGCTNLVTFIKECDSHGPGTSVSRGQSSFYSSSDTWGSMKPPILCYLGNPPTLGSSSKAAGDYQVYGKNVKSMKANASTIDTAIANNVHRSILKRNAIKVLVAQINPSLFSTLLQFNELNCPYSSLKVTPESGKFLETMAIIFSGSYNHGNQVFPDRQMPFKIEERDGTFTALFKDDWQSYFPSALTMSRNNLIEPASLSMVFSKRKELPVLSAKALVTPIDISDRPDLTQNYAMQEDFDLSSEFLANYYPPPSEPTVDLHRGPRGEYDVSYGVNRGDAKITSACGAIEDIDFNVDMTTSIGRKLGGVNGTHKWKLGKSILKNGNILFNEGVYLSVTSISDNSKVVFSSPLLNELNIMPIKMYTISAKHFCVIREIYGTPESLESND